MKCLICFRCLRLSRDRGKKRGGNGVQEERGKAARMGHVDVSVSYLGFERGKRVVGV